MSGEVLTLNVIYRIVNKLRFIYRKNNFMTPALRRLLCNALMQHHFDYTVWYPNVTKKLKHRIQITQNKSMCFACI